MDLSDDGDTREQRLTYTAEALFSDEASVKVYLDLMMNGKIVRNGVSRVGLREVMMEMAAEFTMDAGTAKSIVKQYTKYAGSMIAESGYASCFQ